jgi:amidase
VDDTVLALDATAQAELIATRQISAVELVEAAIGAIERHNPAINAVIHTRFDAALAEARSPREGPFAGVPVLLKDLGAEMAGEPSWLGSRVLKDAGHRAARTSYVVESLQRAGFVVIGRTNTPEFGTNITTEPLACGPTRNPWQLEYSPGGSSGGSAAAVAARMVAIAQGSDGGGSIRIPASYCGLVGMKPSRGRVSHGPAMGEGWAGASTDGVLTRSVRDTARALDVIGGYRTGDPYVAPGLARPLAAEVGAPLERLRVGVLDHPVLADKPSHPEVTAAVSRVAGLLASSGHAVEERWPSALAEEAFQAHFVNVVKASIARQIDEVRRLVGQEVPLERFEVENQVLGGLGAKMSATTYLASVAWLQGYARRIAAFFDEEGFDLLVLPVVPGMPPRLGYLSDPELGLDRQLEFLGFTGQFNIGGQPAIALPVHVASDPVIPIGVQVVAPYGREDRCIRVASMLEEALDWTQRGPELSA